MVSQEDLDAFLARIRRHGGRVGQLTTKPSYDAREALLAALTELEMMYEDLLVADEELRVQGEELRATTATLAATRARYAELFAAAPVGYVVTTGDGVILEANRVAAELLGNPPRGGVGKPLQPYVDSGSRPELRRLMLAVWREGGVAAMDAVIVPRSGRRIEVVLSVARAVDTAGGANTLRWGLTNRGDHGFTSTGARAGRRLPAQSPDRADEPTAPAGHLDGRLLDALFEDSAVGLLVLDADLCVVRASAALTGRKPVAGVPLEAVLAEGAEAVKEFALACLASGRPSRVEIDGRTRAEPDRPRHWTASAYPLLAGARGDGDDGGRPAAGCLLIDMPVGSGAGPGQRVTPVRRG
jgi:PAS domain S-box-containing protein